MSHRAIQFIMAIIVASGCMAREDPGVEVRIRNDSDGEAVSSVQLRYAGGARSIGELTPGETGEALIHVSDESSLVLSYACCNGVEVEQVVDVYIEPKYEGAIEIRIDRDEVSWRSSARPAKLRAWLN